MKFLKVLKFYENFDLKTKKLTIVVYFVEYTVENLKNSLLFNKAVIDF
jgi:hypothetical protein